MAIQVKIFGQLVEIIKSDQLALDGITDTDSLVSELNKRFPSLAGSRYMMAVDKQTITKNTLLTKDSIVALLPPFSGG